MTVREHTAQAAGPIHHLGDEVLFDYATGACDEAQSLLVASHLTYCAHCRRRLAEMEAMGGSLLTDVEPVPVVGLTMDEIIARLDEPETMPIPAPKVGPTCSAKPQEGRLLLPTPLRDYVGGDVDALTWRSVTRGIEEAELPVSGRRAKAKLLRVRAGKAVPQHTHPGSEWTLVLAGGVTDERGQYLVGDVSVTDAEVDHRPVADPDGDCLCLVVLDAPLKLTGRIGRFLNPFVRF